MKILNIIPYGLVVRMSASHADGPGSIPGVGIFLDSMKIFNVKKIFNLRQA